MIIQIGHSRNSDFQNELYVPIKKSSFFSEHTFIFPHDGSHIDSRETLKNIDLFIAEVSYPGTGLGIELGLAFSYGKKILCIYKQGSVISSSLGAITNDFIEYKNYDELLDKISQFLNSFQCPKN